MLPRLPLPLAADPAVVRFTLITRCPAGGDDLTDHTLLGPEIGVDYRDFNAVDHTNRDPTLLAVALAIVPPFPRRSLEHGQRVGEGESGIPDIRAIPGRIPVEARVTRSTPCRYAASILRRACGITCAAAAKAAAVANAARSHLIDGLAAELRR